MLALLKALNSMFRRIDLPHLLIKCPMRTNKLYTVRQSTKIGAARAVQGLIRQYSAIDDALLPLSRIISQPLTKKCRYTTCSLGLIMLGKARAWQSDD